MNKSKFKLLFAIALFTLALEVLLRVTNIFQTPNEQFYGEYSSSADEDYSTWFHTWEGNQEIEYVTEEFSYTQVFNDLGHLTQNFSSFQKDSNSKKIVFLGDSFTEGDGAPPDSSWVQVFHDQYNESFETPVSAYNAGVSGSDVCFNYIILREKLLVSQPEAVFECVNFSDLSDIYSFGGNDRFLPDGTCKRYHIKSWEPLFKYSHVFRMLIVLFTPYGLDLVSLKDYNESQEEIKKIIADQINISYALCRENGINYYLVLMPTPIELHSNENTGILDLKQFINSEIPVIDIYPCMNNNIKKSNMESYFWPINGHYNGKGYQKMGECVFIEYLNR